jgi:hypothetical protein
LRRYPFFFFHPVDFFFFFSLTPASGSFYVIAESGQVLTGAELTPFRAIDCKVTEGDTIGFLMMDHVAYLIKNGKPAGKEQGRRKKGGRRKKEGRRKREEGRSDKEKEPKWRRERKESEGSRKSKTHFFFFTCGFSRLPVFRYPQLVSLNPGKNDGQISAPAPPQKYSSAGEIDAEAWFPVFVQY